MYRNTTLKYERKILLKSITMDNRKFIVIIWHQAGGKNDNQTFYTWNDEESEAAKVFDSATEAREYWEDSGMNKIHVGFIVECTPNAQIQSSAPLDSAGVWVKASEGLPDKCVYGKIKSFLNPDEIVNSFINPVENGYYDFRGYTFSYTMTKDYIIKWLDENHEDKGRPIISGGLQPMGEVGGKGLIHHKIMNNCSKHKKDILGITDMKVLAEMIGDLHYESLAQLLNKFADKLYDDGLKDFHNGRTDLSAKLYSASNYINKAFEEISKAWQISKPFMEER